MSPFLPRDQLSTHEVRNQALAPGDANLFGDDAMLRGAVAAALSPAGRAAHWAHLEAFGARIGQESVRDLGRLANENRPKFTPFDRHGHRIDEIEFHPAYHDLMGIGQSAGLSARAWTHPQGGHVAHAALLILMGWADGGVCCPLSMTYAVVPALREADWAGDWLASALAPAYDGRSLPAPQKASVTMGMAMTEKQGGSDVRANSTKAHPLGGDCVELIGHKWFCSAPMSDAFLTLAYEEEGLSCFLVPRWKPDGTRNAMEIQRLKDKLGDHSNASAEIEYRGAFARRVGEVGRGVRTIIDMVQHTRLDCLVGSAGIMRTALALAMHHAQHRTAFQRKLVDLPAMRAVLADLALEAEAALALAFRVAALFDHAHAGDERAAIGARVLTPIAKFYICKRAPAAVYEAMECLGGAGYIEENGLARLFRQSPLNAIWEGSGNVIALDVQRALAREPAARDVLHQECEKARGIAPALDDLLDGLDARAAHAPNEADARHFAARAALALQASALIQRGDGDIALALVQQRLVHASGVFGAGGMSHGADALLERAGVFGTGPP
jgi:putative acyl-CoA dehydrogenase